MIKINGKFQNDFIIELDIDAFDDISDDKMPISQSDEMIRDAIQEKYGVVPHKIWVGREVK